MTATYDYDIERPVLPVSSDLSFVRKCVRYLEREAYLDPWETVAKLLFLRARHRCRTVKAGRIKPLGLQAFFITHRPS